MVVLDNIKKFAGIILIHNQQVLFLKKKSQIETWTIPFVLVDNGFFEDSIISMAKNVLDIDILQENLTQEIVVNKIDLEKNISFGYFAICISRKGEIKLQDTVNFDSIGWFDKNNLPSNITQDLSVLIKDIIKGKKYVEYID